MSAKPIGAGASVHIRLPGHGLWTSKCRSKISKGADRFIPRPYAQRSRSIRGRYDRKVLGKRGSSIEFAEAFLPSREIEAAIEPSEVPFSFLSKIRKALAFFSVREGLKSRQNKGDFVYKEIVDQGSR